MALKNGSYRNICDEISDRPCNVASAGKGLLSGRRSPILSGAAQVTEHLRSEVNLNFNRRPKQDATTHHN